MILDKLMHYIEEFQDKIGFYPALGVCLVDDRNMPSQTIYDRAVIALTSIKGNYAKRIAYYQDKMQLQMEEEHKLLLDFQNAIENNEFTFMLSQNVIFKLEKLLGLKLWFAGNILKKELFLLMSLFQFLKKWPNWQNGLLYLGLCINIFESGSIMDIRQFLFPLMFHELICLLSM